MNRELTDFAIGLQKIMNRQKMMSKSDPPELRPFVCDGSPLECQIFLVGTNPETLMDSSFWTFWKDTHGFNRSAFIQAYRDSRLRQGLSQMSETRYTIDWILEAARPMKCLETNIYATPGVDLTEKEQDTELFCYLLEQVKPELVIAHGKVATKYLQANPPECELKCVPHFSSQPGWFDMEVIEILQRLRGQLFRNQVI